MKSQLLLALHRLGRRDVHMFCMRYHTESYYIYIPLRRGPLSYNYLHLDVYGLGGFHYVGFYVGLFCL